MVAKNKKIRVAIILQDMFMQGGQYVAALVARGLAERGYHVDVLVSHVQKDIEVHSPHITSFELPSNVNMIFLPSRRAFYNIISLAKYMKCEKPDIVIPMAGHYLIAATLSRLLLLNPPKLGYVEHNFLGLDSNSQRHEGALVKRFEMSARMMLYAYSLKKADKIVAVSKGVRELLVNTMSLPSESVITIYNPVVDKVFNEKLKDGPDHSWLVNKDKPVIVAAGALCDRKDFDLLVRAFSSVVKTCDARLIIFGEGENRSDLELLIAQYGLTGVVSLPGYTDNFPGNLSAADLFALSSKRETFGIVIAEALACGIPVVSTDCPVGPREILADGKYGILVPPEDAEVLAQGIVRALHEKKIPAEESWLDYRLEHVINRYEDLFQDVMQY